MNEEAENKLASTDVVTRLPAIHRPEEGDRFRPDLIGATIIRIGSPVDTQLVEGGG